MHTSHHTQKEGVAKIRKGGVRGPHLHTPHPSKEDSAVSALLLPNTGQPLLYEQCSSAIFQGSCRRAPRCVLTPPPQAVQAPLKSHIGVLI